MNYTKRGLSMMEILVVVMIIGIMAVIFGVGGNKAAFEKQRGMEAVSNLQLIHNAEKRFFLENSRYFYCAACTQQDIMRGLGFMIEANFFDYSIADTSTPAQPGYRAVATRIGAGECGGQTLIINHNNSTIQKGCNLW